MTFSPWWKKPALTVHVASSVGFIGAVAAFLAPAILGATSADLQIAGAADVAMSAIAWAVILPLAAASLGIGIVSSLGTAWGLFRHYWVIFKLALTLIAIVVLLVQAKSIDALVAAALTGDLSTLATARVAMIVHSAGGILVLIAVTVLSVHKPRGMTAFGANAVGRT